LILLISGGVALIATLTINFSVRSKLQTKTETVWKQSLVSFFVPDSVYVADSIHNKIPILIDWDYYNKFSRHAFRKDSTIKQTKVALVLYTTGKKLKDIHVGVMNYKGRQKYFNLDNKNFYIVNSGNDTIGYISRKKLCYDVNPDNKWIADLSMPRKSTITVLHIPPKEFAMIPDSLIRKIPF